MAGEQASAAARRLAHPSNPHPINARPIGQRPGNSRPITPRLLLECAGAILLVILLAHSGLFADRARLASYPYPLDHEEDYLLVHAWRMARGTFYIQPLDAPPFLVGTYNPLFPWAASWTIDPAAPEFAGGRTIAVLSAIAAAIALALVAWRLSGAIAFGTALGAMWLLSRDTLRWTPLFRVDFTAFAFAWTALAMLWVPPRGRWRAAALAASGALCVAAFFTKQTTLLVPFAIALALLSNEWRVGLAWCAATAGLGGLLVLALQLATGGEFWFHTVVANANIWSWEQLVVWVRHFLRFHVVLAAGAAICGGAVMGWAIADAVKARRGGPGARRGSVETDRAPASLAELLAPPTDPAIRAAVIARRAAVLYAMLGVAFIVGAGKLGAADNYMLEPNAGLLLLLAAAAGTGERRCGCLLLDGNPSTFARYPLAFAAAGVLALHVAWSLLPPGIPGFDAPRVTMGVSPPSRDDVASAAAVDSLVRADPAATWCERASFALRHGAPLLVHPFICAQLAREGKWDEAPALRAFDALAPATIIVTDDLRRDAYLPADAQYTERFREWLLAHYELQRTLPGALFTYHVWTRTATRGD